MDEGLRNKQVIFFGFFLSDLVRNKKIFWIDSLLASGLSHKIPLVIENSFWGSKKKENQPIEVKYFPDRFHNTRVSFSCFITGLFEISRQSISSFSFLKELLIKDWLMLCARKKGIRRLLALVRIICGFGALRSIFSKLSLSSNNVLIVWGQHLPVHQALVNYAKEKGATVIFSEGTELQGSVFASERGILNYSWTRLHDEAFRKLPVSKDSLESARDYLQLLEKKRFSNKSYDGNSKELEGLGLSGESIIYVNGSENFASGLNPRKSKASHDMAPSLGSNREVLLRVLELAEEQQWQVLYKDHPNTFCYDSNLLVSEIKHPRLRILKNVDIHEVMDHADAMVSLCSKVVLLALSRDVPVVLGGAFSVSTEHLKYGFVEDPDIEEGLLSVLSHQRDKRIDQEGLVNLIARLIQYYAYRMPDAPWDSPRGGKQVWEDIDSYLKGERCVISAPIKNF